MEYPPFEPDTTNSQLSLEQAPEEIGANEGENKEVQFPDFAEMRKEVETMEKQLESLLTITNRKPLVKEMTTLYSIEQRYLALAQQEFQALSDTSTNTYKTTKLLFTEVTADLKNQTATPLHSDAEVAEALHLSTPEFMQLDVTKPQEATFEFALNTDRVNPLLKLDQYLRHVVLAMQHPEYSNLSMAIEHAIKARRALAEQVGIQFHNIEIIEDGLTPHLDYADLNAIEELMNLDPDYARAVDQRFNEDSPPLAMIVEVYSFGHTFEVNSLPSTTKRQYRPEKSRLVTCSANAWPDMKKYLEQKYAELSSS